MARYALVLAPLASALMVGACNAPTATSAQSETAAIKPSDAISQPGPAVGAMASASAAMATASGETRTILDMAGPNGVVLVFNRSLEWCPYCKGQAIKLNTMAKQITDRGYGLTVLTYDSPAKLASFASKESISFALMSDPRSQTIDAFGVRDPQYTEGKAVGVPFASIFILSPEGKVLAKSVSSDYKVRPTDDEVIALIDQADAAKPLG